MTSAACPVSGPSFEARIRRVLWALIAGLLVVAVGGVVSAWAFTDASNDVGRVERAADALDGVLEGMIDQETGVRGFVLTGREPFLETYGPGGTTADASLATLFELDAEFGPLGVDEIAVAIEDWRELAEAEIVLVRDDRREEAVALVESGIPKERFDMIRTYAGVADDLLRQQVEAREDRQASLERMLAVIGIAVVLLSLVVTALTIRWLRRSVTRPLAQLAGAVGSSDARPFTSVAADAADEVAALARSAELLRVTKDAERRDAVLLAEQAERARIAADLHDGPVQMLFGVQLHLQRLLTGTVDDATEMAHQIGAGIDVIESTQTTLRTMMFDLAPPGLGDRPFVDVLTASVHGLADPPVSAAVRVPNDLELPVGTQLIVHRVIVEALRNVTQHARATHVTVEIRYDGRELVVEIADDGLGFDTDTAPDVGHFGVEIMRRLVESLDGTLELCSSPGAGTIVRCSVPT